MTSPRTTPGTRHLPTPRTEPVPEAAAFPRPEVVDGEPGPAAGSLQVTVRAEEHRDVVVLAGELDVATAPRLASTVDRLVVAGRRHIVVDLDGVTFLDAAAIDALITATLTVALSGGSLRVTHHPHLMRLLEFTRETHRVDIATAVRDAGDGVE